MNWKFLITPAIFVCLSTLSYGQDTLVLRNKQILQAKVVELGLNEIKYKLEPYSLETPVRIIDKYKVERIILESGEVIVFPVNPVLENEDYVEQLKRAVKINFLSPLNNSLMLAFEQSTKSGQSIEVELGLIGVGADPYGEDAKGGIIRIGYKFMRPASAIVPGKRFAYMLRGGYVKPEVIFTSYNYLDYGYDDNLSSYSEKEYSNSGLAFLINIGWQWTIADRMAIDLFGGLGYGFATNSRYFTHYGFYGGDSSFPVAFSGGVRLGYMLK